MHYDKFSYADLRREHKRLDKEISRRDQQPGHCATELRAMKVRKLRIKEEMRRRETPTEETAPPPHIVLVASNEYPVSMGNNGEALPVAISA